MNKKRSYLVLIMLMCGLFSRAQRSYSPHSVLASGNWYKISVSAAGVYKMDIPFFNSLGINTSGISSSSIKLYSFGGSLPGEANAEYRPDDLVENSIQIEDGGDGVFNGTDYLLFFSVGTDNWAKDSVNQLFEHKKNIYTEKTYYFLSIGGTGKRIPFSPVVSAATVSVNSFQDRFFHELDSVNFLASGKEWYGEEFTNAPGKQLSRDYSYSIPNINTGSPVQLRSRLASRSVGSSSRFDLKINNQPAGQYTLPAVGNGPYDLFASEQSFLSGNIVSSGNINVNYSYVPGSFNAQGWLNYFELFCRRPLSLSGNGQMLFRDWQSIGNHYAEFIIGNATPATQVWDVTNPESPLRMQGLLTGNEYKFINSSNRLREYVAFNPSFVQLPVVEGRISNQDLHNTSPADLIIITHPFVLQQAERLAEIHRQHDGMKVQVATTEQVYNEFSGGIATPVAIRDFVKMYYDKYKGTADSLEYLLLFGDASYDYKNRISNNTNFVPAWENSFSLDPLTTYTSDDFFGFLDDNEDINNGSILNLLDIGIGRVPAKNETEAKNFVDKLQVYIGATSLGPWRQNISFVADDEDNNLFFQDAEIISATAAAADSSLNIQKIYLDAFRQETSPGGSVYPQALDASNNQVYNGTLIWNFNGHGGAYRLAEETILDLGTINSWKNTSKLPLFITATCDFAPFDNPAINSLGENILMRPQTGAIALMTTTRLVFANSNRLMHNNYIAFATEELAGNKRRTLGQAVKEAKNHTYKTSPDISNNRKITLLGDPALTLAFPKQKIKVTSINGMPINSVDTLSAGEKISITGEMTDAAGIFNPTFNGVVYPQLFDKPQIVYTLGNDPGSQVAGFQVQNKVLFKGKATVSNGRFSFSFRMPKDINIQYGAGKLSLYAEDGKTDAGDAFSGFLTGGSTSAINNDNEGPAIRLFLNDEMFVNGGITNQSPVLIARLSDSSGINTSGNGVGHDIVAVLDDDNSKFYILNDYFENDRDSYQHGALRFQLPILEPGHHTLKLKAWDVFNNSGEASLSFLVADNGELIINHVLNYPNPFTSGTHFWFEHNKPGQPLQVRIQVLTLTGKIIKTIQQEVVTEGNRSSTIFWDGKDDFGSKPGRGVYIYTINVYTSDGKSKKNVEKLVIL